MLRLLGAIGVIVGGFFYFVGSLPANASSCNGECVRPFMMDLAYYGGEIVFFGAILELVVVTVWSYLRRRRESTNRS